MRLYLLVLLLFFSPALGRSDTPEPAPAGMLDKNTGLSFASPAFLTQVEVASPDVLAAYRHAQTGFPTFNIVMRPGQYDIGRSLRTQADEVLQSFRLAGIAEPRLLEVKKAKISGQAGLSLETAYSYGDGELVVSTVILPAGDRYYILTYTDKAEHYSANSALKSSIFENIYLAQQDPAPPEASLAAVNFTPLLIALALAVPAAVWAIRRRQR
jgi:hypothetical protein